MPRQRRVTNRIKLKGYAVTGNGSPARPVVADRITAIPIDRRSAHCIEDAAARRRQLGHLDYSAGVALVPGMTVDEAAQKLIIATLEAAGNNKTRAAEMLGISLKTLHNKLKEYEAARQQAD